MKVAISWSSFSCRRLAIAGRAIAAGPRGDGRSSVERPMSPDEASPRLGDRGRRPPARLSGHGRAGRPGRPGRPAPREVRDGRRPAPVPRRRGGASARRASWARSSGGPQRRRLPDRARRDLSRATCRSPAPILLDLARARSERQRRPRRRSGERLANAAGRATTAGEADARIGAAAARPGRRRPARRPRSAGPILLGLEDLHWADDLTLEVLEAHARRIARPADARRRDLPQRRALSRASRCGSGELGWSPQRLAEEVRLRRLTSERDRRRWSRCITGDRALPPARTSPTPSRSARMASRSTSRSCSASSDGGRPRRRRRRRREAERPRDRSRTPSWPGSTSARTRAADRRPGGRRDRALVRPRPPGAVSRRGRPTGWPVPLAELADHFILLPAPRRRGGYGFRHALICDAIYAEIPEPERRRLHGRTADAARAPGRRRRRLPLAPSRARRAARRGVPSRARRGRAAAGALVAHARLASSTSARCGPPRSTSTQRPARPHPRGVRRPAAAATDDNRGRDDAFEEARAAWLEAGEPLEAAAVVGAARRRPPPARRRSGSARRSPARGAGRDPRRAGARRTRRSTRSRTASGPRLLAGAGGGVHARPTAGRGDRVRRGRPAPRRAGRRRRRRPSGTPPRRSAPATSSPAPWTRAGPLLEEVIADAPWQRSEAEAGARGYRMLGSCASVLVEYDRGRALAARRDRLRRARRALEPPPLHGRPPGPRPVGDRAAGTRRSRGARGALADGRGGLTTRITALHVQGYVALGAATGSRGRRPSSTEARELGTPDAGAAAPRRRPSGVWPRRPWLQRRRSTRPRAGRGRAGRVRPRSMTRRTCSRSS